MVECKHYKLEVIGSSPIGPTKFLHNKEVNMLYWAAVFFLLAMVSGVVGFSGLAGSSSSVLQIQFFVFMVLGALSLIFGRPVSRG